MKYPISDVAEAWRQTVCFLIGHKWKFPARVKTEVYGQDVYHSCGNPWFKTVSYWECKCRRCRLKTYQHAWYPWWKELWWVFIGFWRSFGIVWESRSEVTTFKQAVLVMPMALAFAAEQSFGHLSDVFDIPIFPCEIAMSIHWWLADKFYDEKDSSSISDDSA